MVMKRSVVAMRGEKREERRREGDDGSVERRRLWMGWC
jgi:hypothetical protein